MHAVAAVGGRVRGVVGYGLHGCLSLLINKFLFYRGVVYAIACLLLGI